MIAKQLLASDWKHAIIPAIELKNHNICFSG